MQIVHICLLGVMTDGFSYQENILTKYHKKMGHDVHVICSRWIYKENELVIDERNDYMNDDGVHIVRLRMQGKEDFSRKFKKYQNVYETLKDLQPDVLFIHGVAFVDVKAIIRYLKEHKEVTVYADSHADFSNSATNWISKNILHGIVWKYYAQMLEPYAKKIYGVLPARVDFLTEMYNLPKEKCELLVMGADDEKAEQAAEPAKRKNIRLQNGIGEKDFLIVTGGKIDRWKAQTLLLMEAVQKLDNPNVRLVVFGGVDEELRNRLNALTDGRKVQFIGWIQGDEAYEYFAAADLVVFPGRHSVFWEQVVGQGIPMICKYWPGTSHVDVGGNVEFLLDDTVEEIYKKLSELMDYSVKYEKMKKVAVEKGKWVFSYRKIAERSIEQA